MSGESSGSGAASFTAGGSKRIRVSVWAPSHYVTASNVAAAKNIVDDMSILKTITNDTKTPMNAIVDRGIMPGTKPAAKKKFFDDIIAACHSNNMQCLAGVDLAAKSSASQHFNAWLHADPDLKEIKRYAQSVVDRLNDPFREDKLTLDRPFDGISFDIEYITRTPRDSQACGVTMSTFYRVLAEKLKEGAGNGTRVLGTAGGALVDPTHWTFQPPGSGNVTKYQRAQPNAIAHPYQLAQRNGPLNDNTIMRPMCYDAWTVDPPTAETTLMQWLRDIIAYAKSCGIVPAGFQIGLKTFRGPNNKSKSEGGYNLDAIVDNPNNVVKRCVELLRPNGIGLIVFALSSPAKFFLDKMARYNFALNGVTNANGAADFSKFDPKNPSAFTVLPNQASGPVQVPLGQSGVDRVSKK
jgi:hypothetical protein